MAKSGAPTSGTYDPAATARTAIPMHSARPRKRRNQGLVEARSCIGTLKFWTATIGSSPLVVAIVR
jgi:hypothetical protein